MGIYKNVMELLVEEEVVRQFKALPPRISTYVNQVEWVANALNQLPPLYATSEKGLHHQIKRGRAKHGAEIRQAVQRALAAIRRDPLRTSIPLQSPYLPFREVLSQLRFLLKNDQIEWDTLPVAVEQALERASQGTLFRKPAPVRSSSLYAPVQGSSPFPRYQSVDEEGDRSMSEGAKSNSVASPQNASFHPTSSPAGAEKSSETFGWDDPLYNPR